MINIENLKSGTKVRWIARNKEYTLYSSSDKGVTLIRDGWYQFKKWETFLKCFEIV